VLLVARSGQEACAELASIMAGWDGKLTVLLRKRVSRHIRRCAICGARRRRELTPASLLGVLPVAVLPAALRHQVLSLLADSSPAAVARRLAIGQRLGPVGPSGFPRPISPPSSLRLAGQHVRAGAAAGGAIIVGGALIGGVVLHHHSGQGPGGAPGAHPEPSATGPARPAAGGPGGAAEPSGGTAALAGGGRPASSHPGATSTAASGSGTPPPGVMVSASGSASASAGVTGTLSVSPLHLGLGVSLTGSWTGTLTLTAVSGPVSDYHITVPATQAQHITLSQTSGSLAAGQSAHITVTAAGGGLFSTVVLDVSPGGLNVVVSYNLNL
jgi:hypothetical protein